MTISQANNHKPGISTYYVNSESRPGVRHVVMRVRRAHMDRWSCTCENFVFVRQARGSGRHCKHIKAVRFENPKRAA